MITRKQKAIIGFITGAIAYFVVYYILSILWGDEKINLGAGFAGFIAALFFIIYKDKLLRFFKKDRK